MSKRRWLTRCRNRAAAGPTRYVLDWDGLTVVVPRRVLLLSQIRRELHEELRASVQQLADDYRRRYGL